MKRITVTPNFGGAPKGSSPVKVPSGAAHPTTGCRTPSETDPRPKSCGFGIQETSRQLWPDCRD